MVASLRCVRPQFQWYQLAYATEIKSIQLHDSIVRLSQKIVSFTLHYITLHYITLHYKSKKSQIRTTKPTAPNLTSCSTPNISHAFSNNSPKISPPHIRPLLQQPIHPKLPFFIWPHIAESMARPACEQWPIGSIFLRREREHASLEIILHIHVISRYEREREDWLVIYASVSLGRP